MATQIEIGLDLPRWRGRSGKKARSPRPLSTSWCVDAEVRDEGWKAFYAAQMEKVKPSGANKGLLQGLRG